MKECQVTGRKPTKGRSYTLRGIAKKKKGIGLKITGKSKRSFLPNLFSKRYWFAAENRFVRIKLSAAAMRLIEKKGLPSVIAQMRSEGKKV